MPTATLWVGNLINIQALMSIPGKLVYHLWHRPFVNIWRDGGFKQRRLSQAGHAEMQVAAETLSPPPHTDGKPIVTHLLTGRKFWHQTAFCLVSLALASKRPVTPILFDDDTLDENSINSLRRLFPKLKVFTAMETEERLDAFLPKGKYPTLRAQQLSNPMFKKLLNTHVGRQGWTLQIDSDLLFFHFPETLLNWHDNPNCPLHAEDITNSYSCPLSYLRKLTPHPVPEKVNTGLLGLDSGNIDWDRMEFWSQKLVEYGGNPHFREQALVALHLAGRECVIPNPNDYVLLPTPPEAHECKAVMHHYVSHSKRWYFQKNWRIFANI